MNSKLSDSTTSEVPPASEVLFDDPSDELPEEAAVLTLMASESGERLDRWLAARLPDRSRSEIQRWIEAGTVTLRARPLKASYHVTLGDEISVVVPAPTDYAVDPEPIPLDVLYEDADLLVINKPAGMVVHPAAGNWHGTLVNAVLYHCPDLEGIGGVHRPGIVHRLDKDTSGVILVAKNDAAHRALQAQFKARTVHKTYLALVYGWPAPERGEINAPIGRDPRHRQRMAVVSVAGGRPATTLYEAIGHYRGRLRQETYALVACQPLTGRTHQIRVHLAHIKHPIVGDEVYGGHRKPALSCPRQFLHAERIRFLLPGAGAEMECTAPLPRDLQSVLEGLQVAG
jgi:23S rRNA pseudouridine1911/1915/1917 synthase